MEFRRTLIVSFFFKFYLEVLQELKGDEKLLPESTVSALEDSESCSHTCSWSDGLDQGAIREQGEVTQPYDPTI